MWAQQMKSREYVSLSSCRALSAVAMFVILFGALATAQAPRSNESYVPPQGMVPNKESAVRIADAILTPIYGKTVVEYEKPYSVTLKRGVWVIKGKAHPGPGGNLLIEISKRTGCIIRVIGTE